VGDEVKAVVVGLELDPVVQRAEIVSEMKIAGGPHSGQHALPRTAHDDRVHLARHGLRAERPSPVAGVASSIMSDLHWRIVDQALFERQLRRRNWGRPRRGPSRPPPTKIPAPTALPRPWPCAGTRSRHRGWRAPGRATRPGTPAGQCTWRRTDPAVS